MMVILQQHIHLKKSKLGLGWGGENRGCLLMGMGDGNVPGLDGGDGCTTL